MKKTQRNFAVEYKSGRRKLDTKPTSIWGNVDLKSVSRDGEDEAMPSLLPGIEGDFPKPELSVHRADPRLASLTPPEATPTIAEEAKEMLMADDTDTINDVDAPAQEEAPVAVKKQRKPRAKNTSVVATTAESATAGTDGPKKRGRKPRVSKDTTPVEPAAPKLAPTADQIAGDAATSAGDEMADLLQLEAENQKLRKMLAEKLRAENADLRKKLNLD
ncbi:transcriptional regulator [Rhizobium sp. CFBP 13726]|uniref:transcriptional regulator n=1 Tax=Rhizobium sp. CFBP 13726 TaxID=2775296 RepID=UPI00178311AB|nr:transcriptional regulator [Rhizobium sp. CFBP 13726]